MKRYFHGLSRIAVCAVGLVPACGGISHVPGGSGPDDGSGASAGARGEGIPAGTGGADSNQRFNSCEPSGDGNTTLVPNTAGWVDSADACNDVGVQGAWFAYGDQYSNGKRIPTCLVDGNHDPSECAQITTPDPTLMSFPNTNGLLETVGTAERVLPCVEGSMASLIPTSGCVGGGMPGGFDFFNMWGAGIGFDFNAHAAPPWGDGQRSTWNASAHGIIGIKFTIQGAPIALRVEFPMVLTAAEAATGDTAVPPVTTEPPTTDTHLVGAPYWGARGDSSFPNSPVKEGDNVITWDQVECPNRNSYVFDSTRLIGIRFHVPTNTGGSTPYDFAISKLTFLRNL